MLYLMILLAGSNAISFANDSIGVNSTSVVRSQLQSIADEVVDSAKFDIKARVAVLVEGEGQSDVGGECIHRSVSETKVYIYSHRYNLGKSNTQCIYSQL